MPERNRSRLRGRLRVLALALALASSAGCIDSLGVGSDCTARMQAVRRQEGRGPDDTRRTEFRGSYTELWTYTSARRTYTFRWGAGYVECEVDGPNRFTRVPDNPFFF